MTGVAMEISRDVRGISRKATCALEEALESYCRRRWTRSPAAEAAKAWALTADEAREVLRGRASRNVINKIARHRAGGLKVMLPLMERVTGQTLAEFNAEKRERAFRQLEEADDFDFGLHRGRA